MEEIKGFRKSFVIVSVFYVIAGIILLFWPDMSMELFGMALGIAMLVIGIAHIIIYFTKDHMMNIMQMDLTIGVVCAAFGAFLLLHPDFMVTTMPFAIGILLLMGSITKLQNALDLRRLKFRHWKIILFFAAVLFVLGALLIYNPFEGRGLVIYIGCSLILEGLLNVVSMLCIASRLKKMAKLERMNQSPAAAKGPGAQAADITAVDGEIKNELEIRK